MREMGPKKKVVEVKAKKAGGGVEKAKGGDPGRGRKIVKPRLVKIIKKAVIGRGQGKEKEEEKAAGKRTNMRQSPGGKKRGQEDKKKKEEIKDKKKAGAGKRRKSGEKKRR